MQALRASRPRAAANVAIRRFSNVNSRGRAIVRDPRKAKGTCRKPRASSALEEVPEHQNAPASPSQQPFQPFVQQNPPQSFGSSMVQSFTWGVGMVLAFTAVGMFFR
ncbi:unnamed protein product [Ascophyllum nodosum]